MPQNGDDYGQYQRKPIHFWTCGFFPGCIYSLLERCIRYPGSMADTCINTSTSVENIRQQLQALAETWSDPIHAEARLTNTHDMGFIMLPHMRPRWELFHDKRALHSILRAAENLATRFHPQVHALRSWDQDIWALVTDGRGRPNSYIVIIDSMCNLDLLYYAAAHTGASHLSDIATSHAQTVMQSHLRPEKNLARKGFTGTMYSTTHVVNFCPRTGDIVQKLTAQGYSPTSCWSRGQAWAILGFAQTYRWTGRRDFLDVACGLAEYFLLRLELQVSSHRKGEGGNPRVPVWDFLAPTGDEDTALVYDASAGVIAANGMLVLAQGLAGRGNHGAAARYVDAAIDLVEGILQHCLSPDGATVVHDETGERRGTFKAGTKIFEGILMHSTVTNNPNLAIQVRNHGLVYADYYLLEFGTQLLRMGLA